MAAHGQNVKKVARYVVQGLVKNKKSLVEAREAVRKELRKDFLPSSLEDYLDLQYLKCAQALLEEDLKSHINDASIELITKLVNELQEFSELSLVSSELVRRSTYYKLINQALDTRRCHDNQEKVELFNKLKSRFIPDLIVRGNHLSEELEDGPAPSMQFVNALLDYLTDFKTQFLEDLHPSNILEENVQSMERFESEWKSDFSRIYSRNAKKASEEHQEIVERLEDEKRRLTSKHREMFPEWNELIEQFAQEPEIKIDKNGDRHTLIVTKPVIVLSKILSAVEKYLNREWDEDEEESPVIDEVQFQAENVFYVDIFLEKETWHGRNIVVVSEKVWCVADNVSWDVSGADGEDQALITGEPVASAEGEHEDGMQRKVSPSCHEEIDGKHGVNGKNGESGGHVKIMAKEYINMDRLQIHSNGGNGGTGGTGENGRDGVDGNRGNSMTLAELKNLFRSPLRFIGSKEELCIQVVSNIQQQNLEMTAKTFHGFLEDGTMEEKGLFPKRSIYLKGTFKNRVQYEFSFSQSPIARYTYLLLTGERGTLGTPGGKGGFGGRGGGGGHPGTVEIMDLFGGDSPNGKMPYVSTEIGRPGEPGRDGLDGKSGVSGVDGLDVGYLDAWNWPTVKYYEGAKYRLRTVKKNGKVWCDHCNAYRLIEKYQPDPLLPSLISRKHAHRRNMTVAVQKKTAIDTEKLLQISNRMQKDGITAQDFLSKKAKVNWTKTSQACVHAQQQQHQERSTVNEGIKLGIVKPANPIVSPTKPPKRKKRNQIAGSSKNLGLIKNVMMIEGQQLAEEEIESYLEENRDFVEDQTIASKKMEVYVKQETIPGPDSPLHAIFGVKDDITQTVSVRSSIETREKVAEKLSKWFGGQQTFDLETKTALEESLTILYEARDQGDGDKIPKMQDLFHPKLQEFYEEYSKFAKRGSRFNWDMIEKFKPALREYAMLKATPGIPFWPSDLVLIAKSHGLYLQYFEPAPNNFAEYLPCSPEVKSPIPKKVHRLASQFEQPEPETDTPAYLTVDKNGNYSKIVEETKLDWSQTEEVINTLLSIFNQDIKEKDENKIRSHFRIKLGQLFFEDSPTDFEHFGSIISFWPVSHLRFFFYFVIFKHNTEMKDIASVKMAFLQISLALSRKEENVTPFLFVVVGFPVSQWARQFSLLLIQNLYGASRVSVYQSLIEENYPKEFLLQVVDLISAAAEAGEFYGAESEPKFEEFLQNIREKYSPLGETWDYSCLNGMTSSNQWYHQLNKLKVMDKLKNIPGENWDEEANRFNQAFYYFYHLFENKPSEAKEMLEFYSNLKTNDRDSDVSLTSILQSFYSGHWNLDEDTINILRHCQSFEEWTSELDGDRNKSDRTWNLGEMIKRDETTFTKEQLNQLVFNLEKLKKRNEKWDVVEISKSAFESTMNEWLRKFKLNRIGPMKKSYHKLVLTAIKMIDNVIRRFLKHGLRETQKLTVLAALLGSDPEVTEDKNLLAQVKTGEGKSWIVLTVAIVRGLFEKKTDIITSSSVLAQRDAREYRQIYAAFSLTVGHVTMENQAQRAREYQKTVIYGESTHFQRDYLIDHFYSQNVRGSREFENIIIDEVDCMFLDKGNSVLYLSHTPPGMDTLEHILLFIWNSVVDGINNGTFEPLNLYEHILDTIYPRLNRSDIEDFSDPDFVIETLEKYNIIDNQDRLRLNLENIEDLSRMAFTNEFDPHSLKKLINLQLKSKSDMHCPNYLKPFVELHLFTWIKSAYQATQLEEKMQYVLHVDRLNSDCEKHPKVVIIDLDTGVDLKESQWSDGLHQFLQIKHGCKLTSMNLKSVFVSNITFFNLYENIFGLTGTLGTSADREFLKKTYGSELLIVPTALPRRFMEEEPLLCSESTWSTCIIKDVEEKLNDGRSILILCETVKGAETLYGKITTELATNIRRENAHLYRRDFEPFTVGADDKNRLEPGTVIVATNLAGRGTDIKLTENLEARGGLHVIFSYLPNNTRVWWQGFGRAARCGDPGSGRLIFVAEDDEDSSESESEKTRANAVQNAIDYMMERDQLELSRVAEIRSFYDNVIQKEEDKFADFGKRFYWFSQTMDRAYKTVLDNLRSVNVEEEHQKLISGQIEDIKELVKFSMLDDWAFWLDRFNRNLLSKSKSQPLNTKFQQLYKEEGIYLAKQFSQLVDRYEEVEGKYKSTKTGTAFNYQVGLRDVPRIEKYATELIHEPALLTKLAKCYIFRKHYDRALHFLKKVEDKEDPESLPATIAFYYTVFCRIQKNQKHDSFIQKVYDAMKTLEKLASLQLEIPNSIKRKQIVNNQKIWISEGLRRQKEAVAIILLEMRKSLEALVGKQGIQEHDFTDICNGHQDSAEFLIKDLMQQETITLPKIKAVFAGSPNFQQLCQNYSLPVDFVENILNASRDQFLQPELLKDLESQLNLPSSSGFWAEIEDALDGHMEVAVILNPPDCSQDNFVPESNEFEFELDNEIAEEAEEEEEKEKEEEEEKEEEVALRIPQNYFKIWGMEGSSSGGPKYFMAKKNTPMSTMFNGKVLRGSKNSFMNNPEFLHFEKRGLAWFDTVAWLKPEVLKTIELENHYSISTEDFQIIPEVDEDMAQEIFQQCVNQDIFDSEGIPQKYQPSLRYKAMESSASSGCIFKILQALETEITALISVKCCYQLELLRIIHEIDTHTSDTPSEENLQQIEISNLATKPFKKFIFEAIDLGLIDNTKVTIKKKADTTKFAADRGISKSTLSFLEKLQNASTRPGSLLGTSSTSKSMLTRKDLSILFPNSDESFIEKIHGNLAKRDWIRSDGKILLQLDTYGNPKSIPCNSDIELFLFPLILPVLRIRQSQSTTEADKLLQKSLQILQGAITTSGTSDISLHPLQAPKQSTNSSNISPLQVFSGFIDYQQELERFQSNGFDYVICGSDSFTSHQVLTSSFTVIFMGTTQVLAGTILNVAPTDKVGSTSPNMQDVIYSFLTLKTGKINWTEWAKYKVINLALGETTPKASIGKSLNVTATGEDPQVASLLTSGKQQVLAQFIQQDFCNQFACHLERYVKILEGTLTTMFGTYVKQKIERNESLEQTLTKLLTPFDRKKARLRFSECLRQAMEKTFEDHPVQDFISQMTDNLISEILSPSLKAMKALNKQAFFDSEFSQIVSEAVTQLESSSDIFVSISGLSQLVPNLLGNVETSIWDKIRKLTSGGTAQVQMDEKTMTVFVNDCRKELVQVMNERVSSLVMNKVAQPLLSHGMQKLFQMAGRQPKTTGPNQAKNKIGGQQEIIQRQEENEEKLKLAELELESQRLQSFEASGGFFPDDEGNEDEDEESDSNDESVEDEDDEDEDEDYEDE